MNTWPDGAMTPFRSEKNTNWEGAFRVPCMIRWPGRIAAGSISNEIVSGLDWLPTLLAAANDPDVKDKLLRGYEAAGKTFKAHLDGYNQLPYLTDQQPRSARKEFFYFNDDGDLVAMRYENWKIVAGRLPYGADASLSGCRSSSGRARTLSSRRHQAVDPADEHKRYPP